MSFYRPAAKHWTPAPEANVVPRWPQDHGIAIEATPGLSDLSRIEAKAVEQTLIEKYGLAKNGGLTNLINSITKLNPAYAGAKQGGL